ncbi:unnamed protein product [Paramecium pentaurelia]|uniref:Uncharacterized protein n=1 Tax=Paramecium pentaurelia TaxID=43138 RepID=A0A8S1W3Y4_9CILI|nr:unnamed protein product [Paramecium pentaurelia]
MLSEPFVLLKNYRQQQDAPKTLQKNKLIPIQKKLVKKTPKSKPSLIEIDRNPQQNQIQTQQYIEPISLMQQYQDDYLNQDQYSPPLFNEFQYNFHDSYSQYINLPDEALGQ